MAARKKKTKKAPAKRGRGRPRKELKLDYAQIEDMAAMGLTREEISTLADVCKVTFWKRENEDAQLMNAMERGRARFTASIRRSLFDEGVNKRNVTALIWLSKNEMGWSDRNQISGPDNGPIQLSASQEVQHGLARMTDEELDDLEQRITNALEAASTRE